MGRVLLTRVIPAPALYQASRDQSYIAGSLHGGHSSLTETDADTDKAMRCSKCGSENPADKRFCGECGSALIGNAQPGAAQSLRAESSVPDIRIASGQTDTSLVIEGERKTVTALFADIKGSMELMEDLDPEEARTIVDPALKLMIEAVRHYGCYVVEST